MAFYLNDTVGIVTYIRTHKKVNHHMSKWMKGEKKGKITLFRKNYYKWKRVSQREIPSNTHTQWQYDNVIKRFENFSWNKGKGTMNKQIILYKVWVAKYVFYMLIHVSHKKTKLCRTKAILRTKIWWQHFLRENENKWSEIMWKISKTLFYEREVLK